MTYLRRAFAGSNTDKVIPPTDAQGDDSVSFEEGYTSRYSEDPTTSGTARRIERDEFNGVLFALSQEIQQYQQDGFPLFITSAENGGSPYSYNEGAYVRFNPTGTAGDETVYKSISNNNTAMPGASSNWILDSTSVYSTRSISTDTGLSGGGNLSADRTISLDFNALTSVLPADINLAVDTIPFYDASTSTHMNVTFDNLKEANGLQNLTGSSFVGPLTFSGRVTASGITSTSDEKLKNEIGKLDSEESLKSVLSWRKVLAELNDVAKTELGIDDDSKQVAFYAQDIEKTHPDMVSKIPDKNGNDTEYKSVSYDRSPVVIASAIESIVDRLDSIDERIKRVEEVLSL